jgi:hypothetical protein
VLYEMWGMDDPVTGQPALLVTEQNITQVSCSHSAVHAQALQCKGCEAVLDGLVWDMVAAADVNCTEQMNAYTLYSTATKPIHGG